MRYFKQKSKMVKMSLFNYGLQILTFIRYHYALKSFLFNSQFFTMSANFRTIIKWSGASAASLSPLERHFISRFRMLSFRVQAVLNYYLYSLKMGVSLLFQSNHQKMTRKATSFSLIFGFCLFYYTFFVIANLLNAIFTAVSTYEKSISNTLVYWKQVFAWHFGIWNETWLLKLWHIANNNWYVDE